MLYDVFISYASEDRDTFVRPLAEELRKRRIETWYDEFSLHPGDSLRQAIDRGLSRSRHGIVILSPYFFEKKWPQWELDGLVQRHLSGNKGVIIPIWHGVTVSQIQKQSPPLANIVAIKSTIGIEAIAKKINDLVHPQGSSLVIARDLLLDYGIETPVVTDDWWLGIVEASVTVFTPGKWVGVDNTWQFPLPSSDGSPKSTGKRLAWTAIQLHWRQNLRESGLSQISHPYLIHQFIKSQPGLHEICIRFPKILMESAPQLIVPEFSEEFGPAFDRLLEDSVRWYKDLENGKYTGVELAAALHLPLNLREAWEVTIDKLDEFLAKPPSSDFAVGPEDKCDSLLALRHPYLEKINPSHTVFEFFRSQAYDQIDFVAWLLSDASSWMPNRIRSYLSAGLKKWGVWSWGKFSDLDKRKDFERSKVTGSLATVLYDAESYIEFRVTDEINQDVRERLSFASKVLKLPESGDELAERFFLSDWIESWFEGDAAKTNRMFKESFEDDFMFKESFEDDFFLE